MSYMFYNCQSLSNIIFENIGNSIFNFSHMFENCINLTFVNFITIDMNKGIDILYMFFKYKLLNLINNFDSSKIANISNIFTDCILLKSLNLTNFNTSLVGDISHMFDNCSNISYIDLSEFNSNLVNNMSNMFSN